MNAINQDKTYAAVASPGIDRGFDRRTAGIALALTGLGLLGFSSQLHGLWHLWTTDALRSFGILVPPLSLWLAMRNWSREDWASGGTWWGLPLLVGAMAIAEMTSGLQGWMLFSVGVAGGQLSLVPVGALFCAYFSGVILFLGGARAWRKAWFPLALWLCVNPVPYIVGDLIDLPLQSIGAQVARDFAHLISVPVSGDTLKLMFSTHLGIFIAPGCDGLRGAAAMGYFALVLGYLHKMPRARWALFIVTAIALAYLFNLLRLCAVVGYYWFALRLPVLGSYGAQIDYLIGGILFICAAFFLIRIPRMGKRS